MNNNTIIALRLKELLNILDARARVTIYTSETETITGLGVSVYELLADKDFIKNYGEYNVSGLVGCLSDTNILITKEAVIA